jgi:hypothetical protein
MIPTITIVIPTIGHPTLKRTLDSIRGQELIDGDRVIVALDTFQEPPRPDVEALVLSYGHPFELLAHDGGDHWQGMHQLNAAIDMVSEGIGGKTDFLCDLGDDDSYTVGAIAKIRAALEPGKVLLFQFIYPGPGRERLWRPGDPSLRCGNISGCCMVAPVEGIIKAPLEHDMASDFVWISDNCREKEIIWFPEVCIVARPDLMTERRWPTLR